MKILEKVLITAVFLLALTITGIRVFTVDSPKQKQEHLLSLAENDFKDKAYAAALDKLKDAKLLGDFNSQRINKMLKTAYSNLLSDNKYSKEYLELLEKEMDSKNVSEDIFIEAFNYYSVADNYKEMLNVLKRGIDKTDSKKLKDIYEKNRYLYETEYNTYEYLSEIQNGMIVYRKDNKEGVLSHTGSTIVEADYDRVSLGYNGKMVVKRDGEITSINYNGSRFSLLKEAADDLGYLSEGYIGIKSKPGYRLYDDNLNLISDTYFEDIGTFSNEYLAIKKDGKYGVLDRQLNWAIEPEHEGIAMDDMKRCAGQECIFVRDNQKVELYKKNKATGLYFDDAKPFNSEGLAAVKKGDKWGFIDKDGNQIIDFKYEDAKSFGGHLGAVKMNGKWGYLSIGGEAVIDCLFEDAGTFYKGVAPVKINGRYTLLKLKEYERD